MEEYLHIRCRKAGKGSKFEEFFTVEVAEGVSAKYGTASNGNHALQDLRFHRDLYDIDKARSWLAEHDEAQLATMAEVQGDVFIRLTETWMGLGFDEGAERPRIDRQNNVIENVKVCGWESKNRRDYRDALGAAVPLYDGAFVNSNHPKPGEQVAWESRLGQHRKPRLATDGIRANFHYNPKHESMEKLLWFAEHMPGAIANSHRINAVGFTKPDGIFKVKRIDRVFAVEVVADGGTNEGLFESADHSVSTITTEGGNDDVDIAKLTLAQLLEGNPALVQEIKASVNKQAEHDALVAESEALKAELSEAKKTIEGFTAKEKQVEERAEIRSQCEALGLPKKAATDVFVDSLLGKDEDARKPLIEDRVTLFKKQGAQVTSSTSTHDDMRGVTEGSEKEKDAKAVAEGVKDIDSFTEAIVS